MWELKKSVPLCQQTGYGFSFCTLFFNLKFFLKMKKVAVFAIDFQNDFCDISPKDLPQKYDTTSQNQLPQKDPNPMYSPTLAVDGAVEDIKRFTAWAKQNLSKIQRFYFTQDSHHRFDIAHPSWWQDKDGNIVKPLTLITSADITSGKYIPRMNYKHSFSYVKSLEDQGEFPHFIWPEHCIMGTWGHNFHDEINSLIAEINLSGNWPNIITKGSNPYTEHFGAFRANIPMAQDPSTSLDFNLINALMSMDEVIIVGEARSHCVANSLRQLVQEAPSLAPKLVIFEDCMSDVPNLPADFYVGVQKIYDDAKAQGVRIETTTSYKF